MRCATQDLVRGDERLGRIELGPARTVSTAWRRLGPPRARWRARRPRRSPTCGSRPSLAEQLDELTASRGPAHHRAGRGATTDRAQPARRHPAERRRPHREPGPGPQPARARRAATDGAGRAAGPGARDAHRPARAGARHPPAGPHRQRPRGRGRVAHRALPDPADRSWPTTTCGTGVRPRRRGGRVLHRARGARQRRQALGGHARPGHPLRTTTRLRVEVSTTARGSTPLRGAAPGGLANIRDRVGRGRGASRRRGARGRHPARVDLPVDRRPPGQREAARCRSRARCGSSSPRTTTSSARGCADCSRTPDEVTVLACVGTATELLDAVRRLGPDAVLTDIRMPPTHQMEGIEAAHAIRRRTRHRRGRPLAAHRREPTRWRSSRTARRAGLPAQGPRRGPRGPRAPLRRGPGGGSVIDPEIVDALVRRRAAGTTRARSPPSPRASSTSSARWRWARPTPASRRRCFLSSSTVEKHVNSIFTKPSIPRSGVNRRGRGSAVLPRAPTADRERAPPRTTGAEGIRWTYPAEVRHGRRARGRAQWNR